MDGGPKDSQRCGSRCHPQVWASLKLAFVLPKEKGFLYDVESMHKTTDAPTSDSNEFLFSGVFVHFVPLASWALDAVGGAQQLRASQVSAEVLSPTHTGCKTPSIFLSLSLTLYKVGPVIILAPWDL